MSAVQTGKLPVGDGSSVGSSPLLSMFRQGNVVLLQSATSGRGLCIQEGKVSGKGIRDLYSQFIVHERHYRRIALQNVAQSFNWLHITEGKTMGWGDVGHLAEFNLREIENTYVALESAFYPGQCVGVYKNGDIKPPAETPPTDRASFFIPFLHSSASAATTAGSRDLPPGWQAARTPDGREYFINHTTKATSWTLPQHPLTNAVPNRRRPLRPPPPSVSRETPTAVESHAPPFTPILISYETATTTAYHRAPIGSASSSSSPAAPKGYDILDVFSGNKVFLVPQSAVGSTNRPIKIKPRVMGYPKLEPDGSYDSESDGENNSEFTGSVSRERRVTLRKTRPKQSGVVWVNEAKKIYVMKHHVLGTEDDHEEFIVHMLDKEYVSFESVKFTGHFISMDVSSSSSGKAAKLENKPLGYWSTKFLVRVKEFTSPYSKCLLSPFSEEISFINELKDGSVIQLYHKPSLLFLSLGHKQGARLVEDDEDPLTMLVYRDRGMGRVSITSRASLGKPKNYISLTLRNGVITCAGPGMLCRFDTDFYVKEAPTGGLVLECVTNNLPVTFWNEKYRVKIEEFSVYLYDTTITSKMPPRDALN